MAYDFNPFKGKANEVIEWLKKECATLRTGRATPAILDSVKVESYGSMMSLSQVASIVAEDAQSLRIAPWDASLIRDIEKAIMVANLNLSTSVDDKGVRVFFPALTGETRALLIKTAKAKLEDARVSLRGERERVINDIKTKEKEGTITEDEKFRLNTEVQKIVDETNKKLDDIIDKKEKEIAS